MVLVYRSLSQTPKLFPIFLTVPSNSANLQLEAPLFPPASQSAHFFYPICFLLKLFFAPLLV